MANIKDKIVDELLMTLVEATGEIVKSTPNEPKILARVAGTFMAAASDCLVKAGMDRDRAISTMKTIMEAYYSTVDVQRKDN